MREIVYMIHHGKNRTITGSSCTTLRPPKDSYGKRDPAIFTSTWARELPRWNNEKVQPVKVFGTARTYAVVAVAARSVTAAVLKYTMVWFNTIQLPIMNDTVECAKDASPSRVVTTNVFVGNMRVGKVRSFGIEVEERTDFASDVPVASFDWMKPTLFEVQGFGAQKTQIYRCHDSRTEPAEGFFRPNESEDQDIPALIKDMDDL